MSDNPSQADSRQPTADSPIHTSGHDREIRLAKLAKLREAGVNPYAYRWDRTHTSAKAVADFEATRLGTRSDSSTESVMSLAGLGHDPNSPGGIGSCPAPAEVRVAGRLMSRREHGKTQFGHIQDETGRLQLYLRKDTLGEQAFANLSLLDLGDFVGARG